MPFQLKTPAERLSGRIPELLQRGADLTVGLADRKPPTIKSAIVTACLEAYQAELTAELAAALAGIVEMHELIEGERHENPELWDAGIKATISVELAEAQQALGAEFSDLIQPQNLVHDAIGCSGVAGQIAPAIANSKKPAGPHMGKYLSAIGITQPMIDDADKTAEHQRKLYGEQELAAVVPAPPPNLAANPCPPPNLIPPPPPLRADPSAFAATYASAPPTTATYASAPPTTAAFPPGISARGGQLAGPVPPAPPHAEPDAAAIKHAWALWYNEAGPDLDHAAKQLGVSTSTLRNRVTGRTEGKPTAAQAQWLVADIDNAFAALTEARAIFASIKG